LCGHFSTLLQGFCQFVAELLQGGFMFCRPREGGWSQAFWKNVLPMLSWQCWYVWEQEQPFATSRERIFLGFKTLKSFQV
jgi:hypothetical protein